ncbi:hypothetical protein JB92DRAFT_2831912 [Gautieria morchelliformis]|nr:hypothetical protein JB92DRAFT_2831912 [Gautieria morchelliformis]
MADSAASTLQPESKKSATGDTISGKSNENSESALPITGATVEQRSMRSNARYSTANNRTVLCSPNPGCQSSPYLSPAPSSLRPPAFQGLGKAGEEGKTQALIWPTLLEPVEEKVVNLPALSRRRGMLGIGKMLTLISIINSILNKGDNASDDDYDDADGGVEDIKANTFEELRCVERDDDTDPVKEKGRGVFGMKFMQDAMARMCSRGSAGAGKMRMAGRSATRVLAGRLSFSAWPSSGPVAPPDICSTLKSSEAAPTGGSSTSWRSPGTAAACDAPTHVLAVYAPTPTLSPGFPGADDSFFPAGTARRFASCWSGQAEKPMKGRLKNFEVEEHQKTRDGAVVEISMEDVLELPSTRDAESSAQGTHMQGLSYANEGQGEGEQRNVTMTFPIGKLCEVVECRPQQRKLRRRNPGTVA